MPYWHGIMSKDYQKILKDAGITRTNDGLLLEFMSRANALATVEALRAAINRRGREIEVLNQILMEVENG